MSEAIRKTKTPKGELRWVIITGEGKEDLQGNLKYSASIVLDDRKPEHAAYLADIKQYWEESRPKNIAEAKSTGTALHPLEPSTEASLPVRIKSL